MKKNRTHKVNAFLMMLLAGTLSFSATAAASESSLQPAAAAQQQPVKGTIVDVNGNPVPGASVMIPGQPREPSPRLTELSHSMSPKAQR